MSTSLIPKILPHFVPNQVLTDTQLNGLRDYLEEHDRLTRTHLIGTGIVCGLHVSYKRADGKAASPGSSPEVTLDAELHTVSVTAGYGITSEGYLIAFEENAYTEYREYEQTDAEGNLLWDYDTWEETANPIYELVNANTPLPAGYLGRIEPAKNPLREQHIKNHVVVLFLEKAQENLKSCLVSDCSNKGVQAAYNCRVLLVHADDLEAVGNNQQIPLSDRIIHVPRLHKLLGEPAGTSELGEVTDFNTIRYGYGHAIIQLKLDLIESINGIDTEAAEFLNVNWNPSDNPIQDPLDEIIVDDQDHNDHNQYHYDFFRELAHASNEFWEAWCRLGKTCEINQSKAFRCHLMLGRIIDHVQPADESYRNTFVPSPVKDAGHGDWDRCRNLLLRLKNMIEHFDVSRAETFVALSEMELIAITPSQTIGYPIARTAIPFYYEIGDAADPNELTWQLTDECEDEIVLSYQFYGKDGYKDVQKQPLDFDVLGKSFLRIEGHIGKDPITVRDELTQLRIDNNLEFDFLFLYLGEALPADKLGLKRLYLFHDFAERCPGMEHTAGVEPGGTFVLVIDPVCEELPGEVVVADFSLSANITKCLVEPVIAPPTEPEPVEPICPEVTVTADPLNVGESEVTLTLNLTATDPNPTTINVNWGDTQAETFTSVDDFPVSHTYGRASGDGSVARTLIVTTSGPTEGCSTRNPITIQIPRIPVQVICPQIVRADATVLNSNQSASNVRLTVFLNGDLPDNLSINWGDNTAPQVVDVTNQTTIVNHPYQRNLTTVRRAIIVTTRGPQNCPDSSQGTVVDIPGTIGIFGLSATEPGVQPITDAGGTRSMAPLEPETSDVATARRQAQIAAMYAFNEAGAYSRNRSYQAALEFVGNEDLQTQELSSAFQSVNGKLLSVYKRANDAKKQEYQGMIELVAMRYMDQLVADAPTGLPTDARDSLKKTFSNLTSAGISLASLKKAWKASELKKATGAKAVDQINRLIK